MIYKVGKIELLFPNTRVKPLKKNYKKAERKKFKSCNNFILLKNQRLYYTKFNTSLCTV